MNQSRVPSRRRSIPALLVCSAMLAGVGVLPASATHSTVTAVRGSGFGYWADGISLFGGAQADTGPTPTVALAADASNSPQGASATTGLVSYGPARLFTSDTITLNSSGGLGVSGSVTSTSNIQNVNYADTQPSNTGSEIFGYPPPEPAGSQYINFNPNNLRTSVAGTATANGSDVSGSATITNGMVRTDAQSSTDCTAPINVTPCGRAGEQHTHQNPSLPGSNPEGVVTIPPNPPPNYKVAGHLHLGSSTTDYFVLVFNEQVVNPDGSITVTPVHEYFGYKLDGNGNIVQDLPYVQGGSVLHGHLYLGQVTAGVTKAPGLHTVPVADFNGNGSTDISVFRPSSGTWFAKDGATVNYGAEGDIPVPADYDGDRVTDVAIFRPSVGLWAIHRSSDNTDVFVTYGIGTDVPVPTDYDGDAKADIAVFRPEFATWWVRHSSTGADVPTTFGIATDVPVPADYDGDSAADIAVFRDGTWFTLPSSGGSYVATAYGNPNDVPVPADYDADGVIDRAVFRPSVGSWYLRHSSDGTDDILSLGVSGDIPVPGDYDGDRASDPAVFRPSSGQWFIEGGGTHSWGIATDVPLPLPYAVRARMP